VNDGKDFIALDLLIQMEYCSGQTLRDHINQQKQNGFVDWNSNFKLFKQLIYGLRYIHQMGLIHRDIKPANIFLSDSNKLKIGDFGLARPNPSSKVH
jgi:serine/threonine protein kinase